MKVLFIEDEPETIKAAFDLLEADGKICKTCTFSECENDLSSFRPDILVLDLMEGGVPGDISAGNTAYSSICDKRFRPIVVYSANPDLFELPHPLINRVEKGRGSQIHVKNAVDSFIPCITSVNTVKKTLDEIVHETLHKVIPFFWEYGKPPLIPVEDLAKRRIAATLDMQSCGREKIASWEQYIVPPLGEFLLTGDILLENDADPQNPASYKLVLTPSCDMVLYQRKVGKPPKSKVAEVLCARCETSDVFVQQVLDAYAEDGVKATEEDGVKAMKSVLSQGYYKEFIPLPELERVFGPMVANLKKLELVPYEQIIAGKYLRRVSVDSPFREQMTWAFLHTGCRPGVPDRDTETWAKQYIKTKPSMEKK